MASGRCKRKKVGRAVLCAPFQLQFTERRARSDAPYQDGPRAVAMASLAGSDRRAEF
jgi:hypothetical protein